MLSNGIHALPHRSEFINIPIVLKKILPILTFLEQSSPHVFCSSVTFNTHVVKKCCVLWLAIEFSLQQSDLLDQKSEVNADI